MNSDANRSELAALKNELERVEMDLRFLRVKADQLETRIAAAEQIEPAKPATPPPLPPSALRIAPTPFPSPPPIVEAPPIIEEVAAVAPAPEPQPEPEPVFIATPVYAQTVPQEEPKEPVSFEMRLGTYWFVRVGVVMVLTAMAFLGNYAYHHIIHRIGPAGKISLMYLASFSMLFFGWFLPRKQEQLRNYGQVLFAGGLAAVYFTTYAAHHFPPLQIITSALLDGVLLLIWTAFIVWLADRKKSEILAVFAIGLAYYTAMITNVGNFTLISNLVLAAAAVFFLVRNRWVTLTFISLLASYGSYFYWRYYAGVPGIEGPTVRFALAGYWTIFTAAVFLTRNSEFAGVRRASFLSFNNMASFVLLALSFYPGHGGELWKLALGYGGLFLVLAAVARAVLNEDELPRRAYLTQGLLLTTLGIILKLSGPTLALVLALESAMLLIFSTQWKSRLLQGGSALAALLAMGWFIISSGNMHGATAWWKAAGVFGLLLFDAAWIGKHTAALNANDVRSLPGYFTILALATWTTAVFSFAPPELVGLILSLTGIALTATIYTLGVSEITLLSQFLLAVAQAQTFYFLIQSHAAPSPIWSPLAVVLSSIALCLWWKHQSILTLDPAGSMVVQIVSAFAASIILYVWLPREVPGDNWIYLAVVLTLAWTGLAVWMRSAPLAAAGQIFLLGTSLMTVLRLIDKGQPAATYVIALIAGFMIISGGVRLLKIQSENLTVLADVYQWLGTFLTIACVGVHVSPTNRFLVLAALCGISVAATLLGARYIFAPGVALGVAGLVCWTLTWEHYGANWQDLVAILILGCCQLALRKTPNRFALPEGVHGAWMTTVAGAFWIYISRVVIAQAAGAHFYLTASWAAVAFIFFVVGFTLRERVYRWVALVVLGCALGRVVLLDVWQLQTLYRILSFLALGIVLLLLGYFYTRFQNKIARWL